MSINNKDNKLEKNSLKKNKHLNDKKGNLPFKIKFKVDRDKTKKSDLSVNIKEINEELKESLKENLKENNNDNNNKCNHSPNSLNTTLVLMKRRTMTYPAQLDFYCKCCNKTFRFTKNERGDLEPLE